MNLAWQSSFMWDGAINSLDMQALAPISHPAEMGSSINAVVDKLNHSKFYHRLFYNAYGDSLATGERTLKAISSSSVLISNKTGHMPPTEETPRFSHPITLTVGSVCTLSSWLRLPPYSMS